MRHFFTIFFLAVTLLCYSCSDDNNPNPSGLNFTSGSGDYYGDTYDTGTGFYLITLEGTGAKLQLSLFSTLLADGESSITLGEGTYNPGNQEGKENTYWASSSDTNSTIFWEKDNGSLGASQSVESGTIVVNRISGGYRFVINLKLASGETVQTEYSGNLTISDKRSIPPAGGNQLKNSRAQFVGNYYSTGTSLISLMFYNGEFNGEEFPGSYEMLILSAFNELALFEEFELEEGTYTYDATASGTPGTFYSDSPDMMNVDSFYQKFDAATNEMTSYYIDGGTFTITKTAQGYRIETNLSGYTIDEETEEIAERKTLEYFYEGALDFDDVSMGYNFFDVMPTGLSYYDGLYEGLGYFMVAAQSSTRSDRMYVALLGEVIPNATHFNVSLKEGIYPISENNTVNTSIPGYRAGGGAGGSYYIDLSNSTNPTVLLAKEGEVEVTKVGDSYRVELRATKYVDWATNQEVKMNAVLYYQGIPPFYVAVPKDPIMLDETNTAFENFRIAYNNSTADGLGFAYITMWNADSTEVMRINPYLERLPADTPPYVADGTYTVVSSTDIAPGAFELPKGKDEGGYGTRNLTYHKWLPDEGNSYIHNIFLEEGTVNITRDPDSYNIYTIEYQLKGRDARTGYKESHFTYTYTGPWTVADLRE